MNDFPIPAISELFVHYAGNSHLDEELIISKAPMPLNDQLRDALSKYFRLHKEPVEFYRLDHASNLEMNPVYAAVSAIFEDADQLEEQSTALARELYQCSNHPQIKGGEFFVVHFEECIIEGEVASAVGLFKTENKESFITAHQRESAVQLEHHLGIHPGKLDKGCMIYNLESDDGFVVSVVDNTNKSVEARYWTDDFLGLKARSDAYHNTEQAVAMCQDFIRKEMPQHFEVSKPDQADMLNRSAQFFKEHERFDLNEFSNSVIGSPEVIDDFTRYKKDYEEERGMPVADGFDISPTAVKKQAKGFKSVLKLDKNFHIYIHGNRELIERGEDQLGRKYYKIYFVEEQ